MMPKAKRSTARATSSADTDDVLMAEDDVEYKPNVSQELNDAEEQPHPAKKAKKAKKAGRGAAVQDFENGVLRALELQNFMNHTHLRIDFDPHVNFIIGKNGSGKSAIVNALIAGFGHRASATGRNTNSAKSLIKHGADFALISVHLANGGEDPWKADEFGDTIVAERRLERTGAGSYKLKDGPDGTARRSTHAEFAELCQHFNIQADNPCALLTQEHAKKFLHQGNEADRYRFFLQAANLESRQHDLLQTEQNVKHLKEKLERATEQMSEKEEIARKAQADYEGAKKLKEIQKQIDLHETMLGWALVSEKERELEQKQAAMRAAIEREQQAKDSTFEADEKRRDLEEELAIAEKKFQAASKELEQFGNKAQQHHERAKKALKEMRSAKKELDVLREQLEEKRQDAAHYASEYDNAMAAVEGTTNKREKELMRKVHTLEEQRNAADKSEKELAEHIHASKMAYNAAIEAWREAAAAFEAAQEEVAAKEQSLSAMKKSGFDRELMLHPSMKELLQRLEQRRGQFAAPPLGPLGLHMSVKPEFEATLGPAVEMAVGHKMMLTWIVSCKDDEIKLRSILKELPSLRNVPPLDNVTQVTIRKPEPRYTLIRDDPSKAAGAAGADGDETAAGGDAAEPAVKRERGRRSSAGASSLSDGALAAAPEAPTLIDAIEITCKTKADSDMVYNHLLDSCRAEFKLLFNDISTAERVTYASAQPQVEGVFAAQYGQPGRRFFRKGKTTGAETLRGSNGQKFTRDQASAKKQLEAELHAAKQEAQRLQHAASAADKARKEAEKKELGTRKGYEKAREILSQIEDQLTTLQSETVESSVMTEIQQFLTQRNAAQQAVETYEQMLAQGAQRYAEAEATFQPLKEKNTSNEEQHRQMAEHVAQMQAAVEKAQAPLTKSKHTMSQVRKVLSEAEKEKKQLEKECVERREYIASVIPMVEQTYGERIHDPQQRDVDTLKREKLALEAKQKKEEAKTGGKSIEALAKAAEIAAKLATEGRDGIEMVRQIGEKEEEAFKERKSHYRKEAKARGKMASSEFNRRLSRKNHAGELMFDHQNETLRLEVKRNSQDVDSAATQDARNLSGGERSFTTLAFELAMWEFCATPFRVLDEFDVFMDDTYRKQAVETLLELCDSQPGRQFLFITPQDMHPFLMQRLEEKSKRMPTITKMKDPRPKGAAA
jgi:structural maintenance of chromosomes protein 6